MKHRAKPLLRWSCAVVCALCCAPMGTLSADPEDNPYVGIVDRNVFGLKPPPPPPDPEANKPPLPKITLTGITTILGNKRALMKTPGSPAKPGEQPKGEQSYILAEGQREGEIEVLEIDEKQGSVKVNQGGTVLSLNFEQNGLKPPSGPPPGPGGAAGPPQPGQLGQPGLAASGLNPAQRSFLNRGKLGLPAPGVQNPGAPGVPGGLQQQQPGTPMAQAVPGVPGQATAQPVQPLPPANYQNLSAEEQALLMLQKELEQNASGSKAPLPQ